MAETGSSMPLPLIGDGLQCCVDPAAVAEPAGAEHAADLRVRLADCTRLLSVAERDGERSAHEAAGLRKKADERDRLAAALARAEEARDALLQSTSWRLTAPLRALTERLRGRRLGTARTPESRSSAGGGAVSPGTRNAVAPDAVAATRAFPEPAPAGAVRITVIVDRLSAELSAGAALALAVAAAMALAQAAPLRILSRRAPPVTEVFDQLLARHGLVYAANADFDWLAADGRGPVVGMTDAERIVIGTCADARLALALAAPERVACVIDPQEVPILTGAEHARHGLHPCGVKGTALVCSDAGVRDALREAGLLDGRDPRAPVLVLPAEPAAGDWQQLANALLRSAGPV
jgi:hypothetical protein